MATIGVFDSGIGGLSVVHAIEAAMPQHTIVFKNDTKNVPYGTKTTDELRSFVQPILDAMVEEGCDVIVTACNTVTTTIIDELRQSIAIPLVGMEPMVKPAAEQSKSKIIAVCATPATLQSKRYKELKEIYAPGVEVVEPDCSNWTRMIESHNVDHEFIRSQIDDVCNKGADFIVLGCTHYHWIEDEIRQMAKGRAEILQPEQPVIEQLRRVLADSVPLPQP